ncbi:Short-chain-fatty-acid--CoA ligase [Slackia heliotrinireducens]|uniref:Acyl-CoA synthetase (AMP-forming)/AMP-acid ligase II n=1 Tax=Slackia heliotrinireducens (strain ATCC 29202 / DSM 20476 / NCTC 11029 / RHS 1) TaxID=471855 RepID=C7N149_SLAHD|nr:class I adenylate-forming enzyme family protein [Slackia heliotrinireducens]ACV23271.1 acyl-CoA synthetase (AMP-forming)/AMP-acid ligase II [Slackia heliotrinireducens DSM 20476]VEH02430.1 Short-chain-fatty-acid--CoA ligase [Slackia heliotrinireducens]
MPITDFSIMNAAKYGDDIALVEVNPEVRASRGSSWREAELVEANPSNLYRRELTWRTFNSMANRTAHLLLDEGFGKGTKVAILMMNCLEWLPIYIGVLKTGAIAVPLNYRYDAEEIKYCLDLSESDALIFGPEFISRMEKVHDSLATVTKTYFVGDGCPEFCEDLLARAVHFSSDEPGVAIDDDDLGAIYFSSGTTGFPKAILHKHKSLMRAAITEQKHHGQTHDDCFLCIPPLYHVGAKMHWMGGLTVGSRAVILRGVNPEWILRTVSEEHCTIVWLLVPWAQDILDAIDAGKVNLDDYRLSQWRLMHIGAQPVPPSLIKRWKSVFPHHEYDTNYGLSEGIGPGSVHLGVENIHKVGAIGIAGYGWEAEVRKEDGTVVEPGSHEVGELCLKGDGGVMECYYNNPEATAETLRDGWLYTGDMAEVDADGFIYLVDRKKDVIIMGGENIYPVQIEDYLRSNDAIKDVAVIGVPDQRLGEIAAAIIEFKPGQEKTEEEMREFCMGLPRYKRPRRYIFAEVPRNATGKIEKPLLRKIYGGSSKLVRQESTN